jgi:hypothetical protein
MLRAAVIGELVTGKLPKAAHDVAPSEVTLSTGKTEQQQCNLHLSF